MMYDLVIIGGGVAGLGAAIYAGRFQMKTAVVAEKMGGTIVLTNDIANYPGFRQISGMDLAEKIKRHVQDYDVELVEKRVTAVEKCRGGFRVSAGKGDMLSKTVIFATGTEWRKLGVPGEDEFTGRGVHYCGLCDGPFYKDKVIAVVGGSDSAAKEAILLSEYASKVYIIYRKGKIRAEPINYQRVIASKKIEIVPDTNVTEIRGDRFVRMVMLDRPYKGSMEFKLDGVFVEIGHVPLSGMAKVLGVKVNRKGEIVINRTGETSLAGVYAAGDVADNRFKQAITGVAEGVSAAYSAYQYIGNDLDT
ncbi:MAG: FAD-dependent oxidoreductase [archaeon]